MVKRRITIAPVAAGRGTVAVLVSQPTPGRTIEVNKFHVPKRAR